MKQENRLFAEQIPEPPRRIDAHLRAGAVDMRSAVDRWITARLNSLETKYEWDAFLTVQNKTYPCHECCEGMQPAEPAGSGAL